MIGNRSIGSPQNKNSQSSLKCYNDKQSFVLSKPPQFLNFASHGVQLNNKDLKLENPISTLKYQVLGKEVLQFNSKQSGNRLKARHKRFMTMEIQGQHTIPNHSHNSSQLEGNSLSQLSFETKNTLNYSSKDCYWKTKTQPHEATIEQKSVRKSFFEEQETHHQINLEPQQQIKKKGSDTLILENKNQTQRGRPNFLNFRPFERIKVKEFVESKIQNQSCSPEITKTKPSKWVSSQRKQVNDYVNKQQFQSPQLKNGQQSDCIFKKTKKRSVSNFQNYQPSQRNIYKPSILQRQTSDENHTSNSSSKETIYYGRISSQNTNSVSNRNEQHQNFNMESEIESLCIKPQNQTHKRLDYSRLIQNSISTPSLKKHTQSVQEQSEPSSSEEKQSEEILTTRLGIAKSLNNTYKKKNGKNSIGKLSELNDELDLGLKLIDDSFQVSGFDYDYASSNIFSNGQECEDNELHNELKTCYTGRSENQISKEQAILEESLISPQCEALKNKLNRILSQEEKNSHGLSQQKLKVKRLSSEILAQNNKFLNSQQSLKMPLLDEDTTMKEQSNKNIKNQLASRSGDYDSKYESHLYGSFIYSKSIIQEERKMLELEALGLRFDLKIGMLTQQTVYLVSHTKEIMKLTNVISKIQNFPKHFHIIQPYSLNLNMSSNRLTIIKEPTLLANKFETVYPMSQANVLKINLLGIRKIIKQVLSVMYQSISSQSVFVDVRDIYILESKNKNITDFNVKIDITQSFLSHANTEQFQYSSFGQNVETVLKIIRILTPQPSTEVSCQNYDLKAHLQSFVDLLEETLTGNKQVGIEEILIHPFVWQDSF